MSVEERLAHRIGADPDRRLTELASRQHGVVALWQLRALGLGRGAVRVRVARGDLVPLHRGVFAVGHTALRRQGHWLAAVLACGPGAVASHRCAGALHELVRAAAPEVSVPGRGGRERRGFPVHRVLLAPADLAVVEAVPCTSVARTLVDLAGDLPPRALERAVDAAEVAGALDLRAIDEVLERLPRPRGVVALRAILDGGGVVRSELERRFLAVVRREGFPEPVVNGHVDLGGGRFAEVDCLFVARRLAVELDGRRSHGTVRGFEEDRRRDAALQALGWRVVRITWRRLHDDRAGVVADLAAFLPRRVTG